MTLTILPTTLVASALSVHLPHVALPSEPVHVPVVDVFDEQLYLKDLLKGQSPTRDLSFYFQELMKTIMLPDHINHVLIVLMYH